MRSRSRWLGAVLCAALTLGAGAVSADEPRALSNLSHDAALRLAAERNTQLLVASLERARQGAAADAARRSYLPELTIEAAARDSGLRPAGTMGPDSLKQRAIEATGAVTYNSPYGQGIKVEAGLAAGLSPVRDTGRSLAIDVSQALLRGGFLGGAADLKQADFDAKIAREQFRSQLNQLLRQVDRAYWDLAFAREDVGIRRRSRDRANAQFEETRENIRRGLLAPGEIYVVEENVVNFADSLVRAEESLALAESALRRLLNLSPTVAITATSTIEASPPGDVAEADSLGVAATRNPAVIVAKLAAERAGATIDGDVRAALPQLDAFGRFEVSSGVATDPLVPAGADRQIRGGLRLSLPLYWGPDVARVRRARTELSQRRAEVADAENAAATAVRDASIRIRARRQRVELTARLIELAQKKLENEREKYKSGLSTLADVVRFQRDLDTAMSGAIRARVDLLTARAEMLAARGDLHESVQVAIR